MDKYFAVYLRPPRPSFAMDLTPEERGIMQAHSAYWRDLMARGFVLVFGPVMDLKAPYGLGIIRAEDEAQVNQLTAEDPARPIMGGYEIFPMMAVVPDKQ